MLDDYFCGMLFGRLTGSMMAGGLYQMLVYVAKAIDYEESFVLGIFTDEATAYIEGNSRRQEHWHLDKHLTNSSDVAGIRVFDFPWFVVNVYELETTPESPNPR